MSNSVPEKLINCKVYLDSNNLVGLADVQLPSLEVMTDTIKGAGIAGEIDSPTVGHYQSMQVGINFRTVTPEFARLAAQKAHQLDIRGAVQVFNAALGQSEIQAVKVVVSARTKKADLGKLEAGAAQENSWEGEVVYLKLFIAGEERIEIDKLNFICVIDGEDQLAGVRTALGM